MLASLTRAGRLPMPVSLHLPPATWAPVGLAVLTGLAFWRSFGSLGVFLGTETTLGLIPVIPLLAVWLAVATIRQRAGNGLPQIGSREVALDYPLAAALLAVAAWLVWQTPAVDGWYFWARRFDLLAAPLFALAIAVSLWGVHTLWWHRLAVAYALLLWPELLLRLQERIAPSLAVITAELARPIAVELGARLAPRAADATMFVSAGPYPWAIVIGDVCSGLNAGLAVALVSVPAAVHLGISWRRALPWIATGVVLALASNLLRVIILFLVADQFGIRVAFDGVHPLLGGVLLALVFGALWLRAPTGPALPRTRGMGVPTMAVSLRSLGLLSGVVALFAVASARLAAFEPLPPIGPPGAPVAEPLEYARLPEGWAVRGVGEIAWQNLFGPSSRSYALSFISSQGAIVKAQLVATPDRGRLRAFTLEQCRVYHGDDVVGRRTVDLGAGGVAYLIDTWDRRTVGGAGRVSVLYWETPVTVKGRELHARLALFVVESDSGILPATARGGVAPGGELFDRADTVLEDLARGMAAEVVRSTG